MHMNLFKTLIASTCLLSSLFYTASSHAEEGKELIALTTEQITEAKIETLLSTPKTLHLTVSVPAKIAINEQRQAQVVAKVTGTVTQINKNIGEPVLADENLAVLESKEIAEAKAAYLTALKREELATQTLNSEKVLKEKKILSEQEYLNTLLAAKEALINLEIATQQLYILGMNEKDIKGLDQESLRSLRTYEIKSPLTGTVIEKDIALGALINSDQLVYTIADLDTVWVELGVSANDLPKMKLGNKILINPIKGESQNAEAIITQLSPVIDEETRTATAIASLPNQSKIWFPGSYVCANVIVDEINVPVAVLKEAVHNDDDGSFIFIPHENGFEKKDVTTGKSDNTFIEIVSGLEPNSPYAATKTFLLKAELGKLDADDDE